MDCSACGQSNPDHARFCLECGAAFSSGCANCGTELPAAAKFCLECGAQVTLAAGDGATERTPADYTPKPLAEKILNSRSALEGERKRVTVLFADVKGSMELAEVAAMAGEAAESQAALARARELGSTLAPEFFAPLVAEAAGRAARESGNREAAARFWTEAEAGFRALGSTGRAARAASERPA